MINKLLGHVNGADIWLVASLLIFVVFFIVMAIHLVTMKKGRTEQLKNIPFNENN
jgi:uncharacterized membrane protein SirB2